MTPFNLLLSLVLILPGHQKLDNRLSSDHREEGERQKEEADRHRAPRGRGVVEAGRAVASPVDRVGDADAGI